MTDFVPISPPEELRQIASKLQEIETEGSASILSDVCQRLLDACTTVGNSASGSWIGYQARIYYRDFHSPPIGARFSIEWGRESSYLNTTVGDWVEYRHEDVIAYIEDIAGNPDLTLTQNHSNRAIALLNKNRDAVISILTTSIELKEDSLLEEFLEEVKLIKPLTQTEAVEIQRPTGGFAVRDRLAIEGGFNAPPHATYIAGIVAIKDPVLRCGDLATVALKISDHLERRARVIGTTKTANDHIFIGHGRSLIWRELQEFLSNRLNLKTEEFNRVSVAGIHTVDRLTSMLDGASLAFLVLTAEDVYEDGTAHARENVIHEAGLFQGRLGFTRGIVLLEEGCAEFSNIHGLGQIRFPAGNVGACFEQVRMVLEREGLLAPS